MWTANITGRIVAKKNSKRVFRNRYSGKVVVAPSAAYGKWHEDAFWQIRQGGIKRFSGPVALRIDFEMKGKLDSDMDNMLGSICDLLQDAGILEDDRQVVEVRMSKKGGAADFYTVICVESLTKQNPDLAAGALLDLS